VPKTSEYEPFHGQVAHAVRGRTSLFEAYPIGYTRSTAVCRPLPAAMMIQIFPYNLDPAATKVCWSAYNLDWVVHEHEICT
jgi:hypothetical protein